MTVIRLRRRTVTGDYLAKRDCGRIPVVISFPGMDIYKEVFVALKGDRWLERGIAVLALDGPGQAECRVLGLTVSMENWTAVGKAAVDWLIARRLTGEISVGYLARKFDDPGLPVLGGIVANASLIWNATGLTTATLTASSKADETVLPGVSGVLRRDIGVQVDHALRRWLIWTVRAGYGIDDYVSDPCSCNGFLERKGSRTSLTYKFTRELSIKGEYRYDQLRSNSPGVNYDASASWSG